MSFSLADIENDFEGFLGVIDKLAVLTTKLAPLAAAIAPLTGSAAPAVAGGAAAAGVIASATDRAIQAHESAGFTPQSGITALATVASAVASSGIVDSMTAAKINAITNVVSPEFISEAH